MGRERLVQFYVKHRDAERPLKTWAQMIESNDFKHFVDLKQSFRSADFVRPRTVFDISGNKYRLIALVEYQLAAVSIEHVLTHKEYGLGKWRV